MFKRKYFVVFSNANCNVQEKMGFALFTKKLFSKESILCYQMFKKNFFKKICQN